MTQSEQIAKQVALKGAIELTKDKFDVKENITEQLEVIKQISNKATIFLTSFKSCCVVICLNSCFMFSNIVILLLIFLSI